jgi:polysaccharide pyruvyl transferase WcaK-like protein
MQILVDQSAYELVNIGDIAMVQSCIIRLRQLWPDAEIKVVARDLERLHAFCSDVVPIERRSGHPGLRLVPPRYRPVWDSISPYLSGCISRMRLPGSEPHSAVPAVRSADIVVAAGGGYLTDAFWLHATGILGLLSLAQRLGKPTAMFGQGIGPISQRALRIQARTVLPRLNVLGLREGNVGPDLALSFGVRPATLKVSGDEALELTSRTDVSSGNALGVNLRVSGYAGVDPVVAAAIGDLLLESANDLQAPLVALPVCRGPAGEDLQAIRALFNHRDSNTKIILDDISTPAEFIDAAASCRVIVTGSYHAAVFGLAQGVPAIGLTKSSYYDAKFAGLRALFPSACTAISLSRPDYATRLRSAVIDAWNLPHSARVAAVNAAARQREAGRDVYKQFHESLRKVA